MIEIEDHTAFEAAVQAEMRVLLTDAGAKTSDVEELLVHLSEGSAGAFTVIWKAAIAAAHLTALKLIHSELSQTVAQTESVAATRRNRSLGAFLLGAICGLGLAMALSGLSGCSLSDHHLSEGNPPFVCVERDADDRCVKQTAQLGNARCEMVLDDTSWVYTCECE